MKTDYLQEQVTITDSTGDKLEDFIIEDIAGEDVIVRDGDFFALINDADKKIYIGVQVKYVYLILKKTPNNRRNVKTRTIS